VGGVDLLGGVEHVGVHARRHEMKHRHSCVLQLAPQRLAERDDAGLGGGVRGRGRQPRVAADARVVHDLALAALEHPRQRAPGQVDEPDEVDLEHRVDLVHVLLLEQAAGELPRVVHEQVERRLVSEAGPAALHGLPRGQVHDDRPYLPRASWRRLQRLVVVERARADEHQVERPLGELLGDRATDAAVCAGDECDCSGKVHCLKIRPAGMVG